MTTLADYKNGMPDASVEAIIAETMVGESELLRVLDFQELTDNNVSRQRMFLDSGDVP